jgi:NAD(P)H dehydrogenase (quinone)
VAKILVLYYSSYGHVATLAEAFGEGARAAGAEVHVKRVPETVPAEVAEKSGYAEKTAPEAVPGELADYDGIALGSPTRYGRLASQMAAFLDQTGGLWVKGALIGKTGAAIASTATLHGGQETTLFSLITNMLHFGMTVVPLPYTAPGVGSIDEVGGGTPYGATTVAGPDGKRQVSDTELAAAREHGRHFAEVTAKLAC